MKTPQVYSHEAVAAQLAGKDISKLAKKLNVSRGTIYNWMTRKQIPDAQQIVDLAEALLVDVSVFYKASDTVQ